MATDETNCVDELIDLLELDTNRRTVVRVLSKTLAVKVTRRGKFDQRERHVEFIVSIGRPAWRERQKIAKEGIHLPADFLY